MATPGFIAPAADLDVPAQGFVAPATDIDTPAEQKPFTAPAEDVQASKSLDLINSHSSKELAALPDFKPSAFYAENKDVLSPEHVDKLADTLKQRTETGLTMDTAKEGLKGIGPGVMSFVRGGWQFLKHVPAFMPTAAEGAKANTYVRGVGFHGTPEPTQPLSKEDQDKRTAQQAEALAGLETAGAGVGGLFRNAVRNIVNQEGTRAVAKMIGVDPSYLGAPPERLNADITKPSTFTQPVDWKQRLFDDAAMVEQEGKAATGRGPILQALNTDADTLAKQGVHLDPQAIQDLSAFENPVNFIPLGAGAGGLLTSATGKILGKVVSREAAETFIKSVGGKMAAAGEGVAKVADKINVVKHHPLASVIVGTAHSASPATKIALAVAPKAIETTGKTIAAVGRGLESGAVVAPALNLATKMGEGAISGAAASLPFVAGSEDPSDITATIGSGAVLGAGGHVLASGVEAAKHSALGKAEATLSEHFKTAPDQRPVEPLPAYGSDANLDKLSGMTLDQMRESDPATANLAERLRRVAASLDSDKANHEIYFLEPSAYDSVMPEGQKGTRGRTDVIQNSDGSTTHRAIVRLDPSSNLNEVLHEPGHLIMNSMPEDVQADFLSAIDSSYGNHYQDFWKNYSKTAPEVVKNYQVGSPEWRRYVQNEIGAELLTGVLRGIPLDNTPANLRQKVVGTVSKFLDFVGVKTPGKTELGVDLSPMAAGPARDYLAKARQGVEQPMPVPPVIGLDGQPVPKAAEPAAPAVPASPAPNGLATTPPPELMEPMVRPGGAEPGAPPGLATVPPAELQVQDKALFGDHKPAAPSAAPEKPFVAPAEEIETPAAPSPAPTVTADEANASAPNLRGKSAQDYKKFQGETRAPANARVQEAQAAVEASKDLAPEQKQAVQTLLSNLRTPHDVVYNAAKSEGGMERAPRRADIEAARGTPELRDLATKLASIPLDARATKNGDVQLQFWSGDKVLSNVETLASDPNAQPLIPYEVKEGKLTSKGSSELASDLRSYTENQDNGYRGDGAKLNRPSNPAGFIPDENPDYIPVKLTKEKSNFLNLLMGEDPPESARMNKGTVPIQVRAKQLASLNDHSGIEVKPRKTYKEPYQNVAISDYNPLRVQMQEAGVDTSKLTEAHEWVNAKEIKSATPRPDIKVSPTSTDVTAAGFMPAKERAPEVTEEEARQIVHSTLENGGATFDPRTGKFAGSDQDAYIVSIYPERSKVLEGDPTKAQLLEFLKANSDLLSKPGNSLGTWRNEGKTYVDVVVSTPDRNLAELLGKRYNQKAICDARNSTEIPTGGTGEPVKVQIPEAARLPHAQDELTGISFMPSKEARAVHRAAIRDEETGKIYEAPMHALATLDYLKEKFKAELDEDGRLPAERELDAWNSHPNLTEGFTTNGGEFLNREEAFNRALEMGQYTPHASEDASLESQRFNRQQQGGEPEPAVQQFMPQFKELPKWDTAAEGGETDWSKYEVKPKAAPSNVPVRRKSISKANQPFSVGEPIKAIHFSGAGAGIKEIDPAFMKLNSMGASWEPNPKRSFFYVEGSEVGNDAKKFGNRTAYAATIEGKRIYDATGEDPLGFFKDWPAKANDAAVTKAGFDGVMMSAENGTRKIVMMYQKTPVELIGHTDAEGRMRLDERVATQFMPAKGVDLKDYIGKPVFVLTTDRMGVGHMEVGPTGAKQPLDIAAQGGRGFMHIYKDGGWAFADMGAAKRFLTRVKQIAGDGPTAIAALTVLGQNNHMNSPTGLVAYHQALQAAVDAGAVSKRTADAHIKEIFSRLGETKSKLVTEENRALFQKIKTLAAFGEATRNKEFNFEAAKHLMERANQRTLPINYKDAAKLGIDVPSIARDIRDPGLHDLPTGSIVGLVEIPKDQTPEKTDFHFSYPWTVEGKAIGFLNDEHHVSNLTSDQRIYQAPGQVGAQPLMTVMPRLDKMEQLALQFMPAKDAAPAEKTLADGLRQKVRRAKLVTADDAAKALGEYPKYLNGVVKFLGDRREALKEGKITKRDLAKAYAITVASQGSDSIKLATLQKALPDFNPDKSFLSGDKIRPEEAAAWWLGTAEGKKALDNLEAGNYDAADWEGLRAVRKAFGDDRISYSGILMKPGERVDRPIFKTGKFRDKLRDDSGNLIPALDEKGQPRIRSLHMNEGEASMANLDEVVDNINAAKGDGQKLTDAVQQLRGIGPAKAPFISHILGFGGDITLDAVEINYWLTGKSNIKRVPQAKKEFVDAVKHDEGSQGILKDRIVKRLMEVREKSPEAKAIPEEAYLHVMHHWLWDRAKGTETTHEGVYKAALQFMPGRDGNSRSEAFSPADIKPSRRVSDWANVKLGRRRDEEKALAQ